MRVRATREREYKRKRANNTMGGIHLQAQRKSEQMKLNNNNNKRSTQDDEANENRIEGMASHIGVARQKSC